jgi:hypothetical protein
MATALNYLPVALGGTTPELVAGGLLHLLLAVHIGTGAQPRVEATQTRSRTVPGDQGGVTSLASRASRSNLLSHQFNRWRGVTGLRTRP